MSIETDADEKLQAIIERTISRTRLKEPGYFLNKNEKSGFKSDNCSLGYISTSVSPLFSFHSRYVQKST